MNLKSFQAGLPQILFSSYGDTQFDAIRAVCGGMSGTKTAKIINFAVECLEKDEIYFEIGVFTGFTMIAAGLGHHRHIIGAENSSEFGDMKIKRSRNLDLFSHPLYQVIETDFRNVALSPENEKKTGVLYIDGKHEYKEVMDSLSWAENGILSDNSIVVLDDISVKGVSDAIHDWVQEHKEYKIIFYLMPHFDDSDGAWSHDISIGLGIAILKRELKGEICQAN